MKFDNFVTVCRPPSGKSLLYVTTEFVGSIN